MGAGRARLPMTESPPMRRSVEPAPADAPQELEELPFDQYQRYRLIADLCRGLRSDGGPLSILDVGGRTGILRRFLPDERVELVDVDPSDVEGLVLGTGDRLPFRDRSFDVVTAADTLEHVPVARREAFVKECCRVARRWAVLAGPYDHPRVAEAEELLQGFLREKLAFEHRYLNEHRELGLPDRAAVEQWCREAGARDVHVIGHGNLDRWLTLLTLELYLDDEPRLREIAKRLYRFYGSAMYPMDRYGVVYRHAVVAALDGTPTPSPEELFGVGDAAPAVGGPFASALAQLGAFDRERHVFLAERERLEGEIARRDHDLAGHKESIKKLEKNLEGHRDSLSVAREDLEGHAAVLKEVRHDLAEHEKLVEELKEQAAHYQAYSEQLEKELNRVNELASSLNDQLFHATRWQRKIDRWKARLRRMVGMGPKG